MKKILYIAILLLLSLLCSAPGCNDQSSRETALQRATRDSLEARLGAPSLPAEVVHDVEQSALSKLSDYADYRAIARDSSVERAIRDQAAVRAREMMISGKGEVVIAVSSGVDSAWIDTAPVLVSDSAYAGRLGYRTGEGETGSMDFRIMLRSKAFGEDTLHLWEVFLAR